jgi:hypothetical protein
MQKLAGILNEEETQKNNPFGKVVYHGSSFKLDLNSLDIARASLTRDASGNIVKETTSEKSGNGFYVTKDLWSHPYNTVDKGNMSYLIPAYKEGKSGPESAEKYSMHGDQNYIYQITLKDDFNFEKYDYMGIDGRNVSPDNLNKLLSKGIDGLYNNDIEAVILNKDKIASLKLIYTAKDTTKSIVIVDSQKAKWHQIFSTSNKDIPYIIPQYVVKPQDVEKIVSEKMGGPFINMGDPKKIIYTNIDKNRLEEFDEAYNNGTVNEKFPITNIKVIIVNNFIAPNWEKVG